MVSYAAGSTGALQPGEDQQIIDYLSATQTPEAVNRRQAQAAAASAAGRSMVQRVSAAFDHSSPRSGNDLKMIGFVTLVCLGMLTLIVRRPGSASAASSKSEAAVRVAQEPRVPPPSPTEPLILRLASITAQTAHAKTLRFIVPSGRKLHARPGQFLTFSFLFDGKKVARSYSICSSPARTGYVEITTKRVSQGCASIFLNDRAPVGMTVEANGPFGEFCFDENQHHNVVLIAAGSGITPIMAMLRYMDDLCIQTSVTLLYCVRTSGDIIFESELADLQTRLKNFQYHVLLSEPHADWSGPRGRISREFIKDTVNHLAESDFFLCGPAAFMDVTRAALTALGVKPERIRQESFGGAIPRNSQPSIGPHEGAVVAFGRSGITCTVRGGQTLLEAAEEHGVHIPSSCRQGQCGTCKTKLLSGNVRMDAEVGLDPYWKAQGFVLTCVGHAEGAVKLDA
jgi:ferredoxin-NADP reductase